MNSSDQAYSELRNRILDGRLVSGTTLKERDLCAELSISRTPVREALRRLSADGLAEIRPRRSIIVSSFDADEIEEIFELGILLESFVASLAAEKATDEDVRSLNGIVEAMERTLSAAQAEAEYVRLDQSFHDRLSRIARSKRVADVLHQTVSLRLLMKLFHDYQPTDYATSLSQHRIIAQAIAARNADWAAASMRSHIRTGQAIRTRAPAS